ncbi:ribosome biogenesis GTPase YlqF [Inediibacterium massiliense]|uniref:ribosome biogenesis GTPase YlqF n=1 Tax=Inediibacterium massiliense TaxID=1658111 RepID=UPI0006B5E9F4|nr:ribosome biogenesis GTPase YlqF [Inediibacterium massiliense]
MEQINWYPGHMKKTKELIQQNLKLVDVVVELLDARIPLSSRNPQIDDIVSKKPRVIILNKSDLANTNQTRKWMEYFKSKGLCAVSVNTMNGLGFNELTQAIHDAFKEKANQMIEKGMKVRPVRVMIVGVPNVGKSSLINRLTGKKSAKTGNKPGVTRGKQWVRLKGNIELLDTPGILWPKFEDQNVGLKLAFTGAIKDDILDIETIALRLIEFLSENYPDDLMERYKLDELDEQGIDNMDKIAKKRGCILSGGRIDYTRVANIVIDEFREGKIGRITLETPNDFIETIE